MAQLRIAAYKQHNTEVLRLINEEQIDPNDAKDAHGQVPLCYSCARGFLDTTKLLVEHGANINVANDNGMTPLMYAINFGNVEVVEYLIKNGAKLDDKTIQGYTIFDIAKKSNIKNMPEILEHIVNNTNKKCLIM